MKFTLIILFWVYIIFFVWQLNANLIIELQPASSTYADCEETDASNGGSQSELIPPSEKEVNYEPNTIDDGNTESSSALDVETEDSPPKARSADYEDRVTVLNGSDIKTEVTREIREDEDVEQEDEYGDIDLDGSEDDQYEDDSGDENGSHSDSNELENDRENGDGEEVSEVSFKTTSLFLIKLLYEAGILWTFDFRVMQPLKRN